MDAVEYFLFEERRGYCEQFSSSLAVMARSLEIPTRIATGYVSGEYNPFTGLYEVKASDAHAWVEVYFPGHGWSTFDPTPSFDSTPWEYQEQGNLRGSEAFSFVASKAGETIGPVLRPAGSLIRGVASLDPGSIVAGLPLGAASITAVYSRRYAAKKRRKSDPKRSVKVSDARLYSRYTAISAAFEEAGVVRERYETPEEWARRASEVSGDWGMAQLGGIYLYARFRSAVPAELVEEFDRLEPGTLEAAGKLKEARRFNARYGRHNVTVAYRAQRKPHPPNHVRRQDPAPKERTWIFRLPYSRYGKGSEPVGSGMGFEGGLAYYPRT